MADELDLEQEQTQQQPDESYQNLLTQFNDLKKNMVPKDQYNQVLERNKQLSEAYANNLQSQDEGPKEEPVDHNALRQELFGDNRKEMTNLEFVTKALKFREAAMAAGERDPFLPTGGPEKDSLEAKNTAEKVARGLQAMVDDSEGNPEAFRALYQARCEDIRMSGRNNNNRRY